LSALSTKETKSDYGACKYELIFIIGSPVKSKPAEKIGATPVLVEKRFSKRSGDSQLQLARHEKNH
jgi:hypothetical protein